MTDPNWHKGAAFYQIYPRSFCDTNGDGVGDLPGITQNLDYVADLGVEGIWISPFFPSPMKDFGYDVSNFRDVDPMFGTLADFDALLEKAHSLNLKIIIDLVFSHTSDQHEWFQDSRQSGKYKDWYIWADAQEDGSLPNNWVSLFGGAAWEFDAERGQYYLHNFLKEQPDLNFHNPEVQEETLDIVKFWLDRGVDGLRLDVVNFYFHDQQLRDNPARESGTASATQFEGDDPYSDQQHIYDKSQPEMFDYLRKLRALTDQYPGVFMLGEIGDDHPYRLAAQYTDGDDLLHTTYNPHMMAGTHKSLEQDVIRGPIESLAKEGGTGWPSWAFSNHDVVRAISRWHPDQSGYGQDAERAKMLIALLGCLRGSIYLYQGEELGLPEVKIPFEKLQDPWGKHLWPEWQGRDGCRTPIPWRDAAHTGFSTAEPWLPIPSSHHALHVAAQEADTDSTLHFTREFLHWRRQHPTLRLGDIEFIDTEQKDILAFWRIYEGEKYCALFNLLDQKQHIDIKEIANMQEIFKPGDYKDGTLRPNGFMILK